MNNQTILEIYNTDEKTILNKLNQFSLKYIIDNPEQIDEVKQKHKNIKIESIKNTIFTKYCNINSYIWMLYVIIYGNEEYKLIHSDTIYKNEQEFRFKLVKCLQKINDKTKDILKVNKLKIEVAISELGNGEEISLDTLIICVIILKEPVFFAKGTCGKIINYSDKQHTCYYCVNINEKQLYLDVIDDKHINDNYYLVDNITKPFKSISSYKLDELKSICGKMKIDTNITGINSKIKSKTKTMLYEELIHKIEI